MGFVHSSAKNLCSGQKHSVKTFSETVLGLHVLIKTLPDRRPYLTASKVCQ